MRRNSPKLLSSLMSWMNLLNFSLEEYFIKCQKTILDVFLLKISKYLSKFTNFLYIFKYRGQQFLEVLNYHNQLFIIFCVKC